MNAARMYNHGLDGMRYLGADPTRPADRAERLLMRMVNNAIVEELERSLSA